MADLLPIFGTVSAVCSSVGYVPQIMLTQRRRSVVGFSADAYMLKLLGGSALVAHVFLAGAPAPVLVFSCANLLSYVTMLLQCYFFGKNRRALVACSLPILIMGMALALPALLPFIGSVKPITVTCANFMVVLTCLRSTFGGVATGTYRMSVCADVLGMLYLIGNHTPIGISQVLYCNDLFWSSLVLYLQKSERDGGSQLLGVLRRLAAGKMTPKA